MMCKNTGISDLSSVLGKIQRYRSSFLDLLAADLRLNGRLALAQSCSHRSCQRNRGNFCLINNIGFYIFPLLSSYRYLPSCLYFWHRNFFRASTSFTVTVAENHAGENLRSRCEDRTVVTAGNNGNASVMLTW